MVVVAAAPDLGAVVQRPRQKGPPRLVRPAGDAAIEPDSRLGQGLLGSRADAAADQRVHLQPGEKTRQGPVAASGGDGNPLRGNPPILHIVNLKLAAVAEVLEHLAVLIGYRDFHAQRSFSNFRGQAAAFLLFLL